MVIVLVSPALTGCSGAPATPQDNTLEVCNDFEVTFEQVTKDSPEGRAFSDALTNEYRGTIDKSELHAKYVAYSKALAAKMKPLADKATRPELKSSLNRLADLYDQAKDSRAELAAFSDICAQASPSPSPR
jgi:hypothetical protein